MTMPRPVKTKKDARPPAGPAPHLDDGTQLARVRAICLGIPGSVEKLSHGAPTFFTPHRVYAMFVDNHHNDGHLAAWIPAGPGVQQALIDEDPHTYFLPPYVGCNGWVGVELAKVDDDQLGALLREAHRLIESKSARPKPAASRAGTASKRGRR